MQKRAKTTSILVLTFLLVGVLTNCASPTWINNRQSITIAVVESNPGTLESPDPQSVYAGVKLALDQFRERNGINVQVDLYDDQNDPIKAAQIAEEIANSNAVAVIGHSSIETSNAAGSAYDLSRIPVINAVPMTEHLTEDHPYHFNITYTAESEAAYLASYLIKIDEKFTAGVIHANDGISDILQKQFRNMFAKHGGVVTFRETIALSEATPEPPRPLEETESQPVKSVSQISETELLRLNEIVAQIVEMPDVDKPEILFIAADEEMTDKLAELLKERGVSIPIKGADILDDAIIANMIGTKTASIISTEDGYGQALAKQFRNTFVGLGGEISVEEVITAVDSTQRRFDEVVSRIITEDNPGTIFIAADDVTAAQLVILMKRKGVSHPIVGASSLSTPVFLELIGNQPEESTFPGYFTNGIFTTRALIFDSANRYANQFLADYQTIHRNGVDETVTEPGDRVINGYEAALALTAALQNSNVQGSEIRADRQEVYQTLLVTDGIDNGVQGIISPIYFEPSRNITRAARFGVYQNGEIVSANIQFEPISTPSEIKDLQDQIDNGRIMTVNGGYVYKANVVYAGVDILSIEEIDIKTSTYNVDFYLWFRYRPNERDEDFKPDEFVFTNAEDEPGIALIREESNPDGTVLKTYRVSGPFKNQFRFYDYPFEHQDLIIEFRNQNATTSFIQYVVDRTGMRYESEDKLLENFRDNGAFDSIFGWRAQGVHVAQDIFPTFSTFGSPQNFGRAVATNYSLININVDIQRDSLQYIVKSLLPLLITLILAYITFFLPLGHSERLAVGSTALLTTAFFHLTLADALPEIGYTVAMEYLFYASYAMSALMVLLETLSIRLEKRGEDEKKKADKEIIKNQRETLNMLGRLIYPAILFFVFIAGFFVYNGTIRLGPNEAESKHIVDIVIDSGASNRAKVDSDEGSTLVRDEIKLTFSTWRPEDSDQIQILLNEFQAYAQDNGKNIVVEHRPVVSVNYDSILDIQLSREEGPDLLYVRPFSVDGSIARYLTQLNTLPIEENYDVTKTVPWMNRSGAYYAVPYVGVVQGIYYNRDFFEEHPDIPSPDTWKSWKDFLSNVQKIKDTGKIPIANALNQSEDSEMFMSVAANVLGGPDGRASLMRTDSAGLCFNDQKVVNMFQAMETLKPYLPDDAATINSQASKELFFNQDAVLLFGGSWDLQTVSNGASFDWDVFAVPSPFSKTYVIFQPDAGIGINRDTRYPQETRMFLEWLMTKEAVDLTAQNLAGFYPLSNTKSSESSGPNDEKFLALVNNYDSDIRWMYTEISSKVPSALEIIRNDLYNMAAFDLTPQEAAQNLQDGLGEWYEPAQSCR